MNAQTARAYRTIRRDNPHMPAAVALAIAKRKEWPAWASLLVQRDYGDIHVQGNVNGVYVVIRTEVEDDPDISFLGTFTDNPVDAIPNPEYQHGRYRYFRPELTTIDTVAELRRTHGKTEARAIRARQIEESARAALQPQWIVTVELQDDDCVVLGSASLGACYIDDVADLLWTVDDHGMIDQAMADAGRSVDSDAA